MFKRRSQKISLLNRLRNFIWPRIGWRRMLTYYGHRLGRLSGSAHHVALGFAVGMSQSCSPLVGIHAPMAMALAWLLGGNVVAAALGSLVLGNPAIMPMMLALAYALGAHIIGGQGSGLHGADISLGYFWHHPVQILLPLTLGWLLLGTALGLLSYWPVNYLVSKMRAHRAARQQARWEAAAAAAAAVAQMHASEQNVA